MKSLPFPPYGYKNNPHIPAFPDDKPIFVFDGVCVLCSAATRWVVRQDKKDIFRFAPAQSPLGQALYNHYALSMNETFLVLDEGLAYKKSEACFRIVKHLGFGWQFLWALYCLPRFIRDSLYTVIANNRYQLFGKTRYCQMTPGFEDKLLQ